MGWQEAKKKHEASGNINDQAVEDFVARRVLRGLGYVAKQVPLLERYLGINGEDKQDDTLWTRTRKILELAIPTASDQAPQWFWRKLARRLEVRTIAKYTEAVEIFTELQLKQETNPRLGDDPVDDIYYLVLVTKYVPLNEARVYFVTPGDRTGRLTPPFTVVGKIADRFGTLLVICQEAEAFVKQFGPYAEILKPDA